MFLKKIVDWISHNQQLRPAEEINEFFIKKPEEVFIRKIGVINADDICSSSSISGNTSVVDFDFVTQNNTVDNTHYTTEENKNSFARSQRQEDLFADFGDTKENAHKEFNNDKPDCNPVEIKRKTRSEDLATDLRTSGDQIYDHAISKHNCNPVTKASAINSTAHPSAFCKKISHFEHCTPSEVQCSRSIFTQTESKFDKRRSNLEMKYSYNYTVPHTSGQEKKFRTLPVNGSSSAFFPLEKPEDSCEPIVYGTLYVLGLNRTVPAHLAGKINTKYTLRKKTKANGLKEAFSYVQSVGESICTSSTNHVISYPLPNNRSVVVAFKHDSLTDMFQIGRYEKHPVDFKVDDVNPSDKARHGVSRFACRILVSRDGNHEARVYAAAYDASQAIFLGEHGISCSYQGKMDGFTTNGVLIMQPDPGTWREVSVSGYIYPLRSSKMHASKRPRLPEESNILQDGTLIDLCGVTLIWRTPEGLKKIPNEEYLSRLQSTIHRSVPDCRLICEASNLLASQAQEATKKAYVYLSCGHVVGLSLSKPHENNAEGLSCPVCRVIGPLKELIVGAEPGFYMDREFPSYAFKPCGHVASQKTVEYWSSVEIPNHRNLHSSLCPFCCTKLNFISKYVKLTLPVP